ncbi:MULTISPECIES: ADP compounds hydrolase NudE [Vibrio]|jgi:ADP-ribose diphosphatase|uniref:ADP compounds hydrolase NudE n=4 Tax=Vibrio cyclitrophicus TaxID=47951 RepID=A0A7Z1S2G0_9VIBR|nr:MULTISPECIES: ADP compounds hydrolase NudE [Vibrio]KNH11801.1 ADP-ribose diphosphatase [Vibrio lentus]MBY7661894.1 ADP compounds hydrolase NudE [Vibrio atlanticus]ERM59132.1 ADP compounds hydrolase NudE [Vibrio cyclitrophicus FF75]KAA8597851.1 ADP compounds hydrolase NudE [Vibrio cyclitrophicus]MBE8557348.1 ADP compounds hydrolase NudE [Vibrio sp. OPT24]|tara:strand:- start:3469 stop:4020 length:552 start_codon:yes stop_codon:yes gene_type:complete
MTKRTKPEILAQQTVAQSKLFSIESLDLRFSNGEERTYERMKPSGRNAVMMVPITEQGDILLVREYAAGTERYELGFPKGLIDPGEQPNEAAVRELKEEIGFGANKLTPLKEVILAPSYFSSKMTLFIAEELYPEKLEGDEPEPLDIVRWPLAQAEELLTHLDFCEARSITALLLTLRVLNNN